ncbi:MAG: hypothetical protein OQJ77_00710 [Thiovulaceae bacterium]|nr:hypothetical protein [Sulfurimonadaceae bacterium]MCW9025809.1 hypothetical protein [Sulfurimonadaceae bacterium]
MFKKFILIMSLLFSSLYAESCWERAELAEMAQDELDGKTKFSIRDAISCKPIVEAEFYLGKSVFKSDDKGMITIPTPPENMDTEIPIRIEKKGYIPTQEYLLISFGTFWKTQFLISKNIPKKSARFVLSWGEKPMDLDLHLKANMYHVSHKNTQDVKGLAKLDRDSRRGYGPETITLKTLDKNDDYSLMVYRYSYKGKINQKAQMKVYLNNKLDAIVTLPNTNERCLELATITNNEITYKTKILDEEFCK